MYMYMYFSYSSVLHASGLLVQSLLAGATAAIVSAQNVDWCQASINSLTQGMPALFASLVVANVNPETILAALYKQGTALRLLADFANDRVEDERLIHLCLCRQVLVHVSFYNVAKGNVPLAVVHALAAAADNIVLARLKVRRQNRDIRAGCEFGDCLRNVDLVLVEEAEALLILLRGCHGVLQEWGPVELHVVVADADADTVDVVDAVDVAAVK
jgi:hypothetical protein